MSSGTPEDMSSRAVQQDVDGSEHSSRTVQTIHSRDFDDGSVQVSFQIIRLEKQVFVYVGLVHPGDTLDSLSMAMPMGQKDPVSTRVLSKQDLHPDSTKLSRVICSRTGMSVLASYNIPPGAVSDTVKNDIMTACIELVVAS